MRKLTHRWLLLALCLGLFTAPAAAQIQIIPPATQQLSVSEVDGVMRKAQQFETEQRWGEALSIYEDALRDFPQHAALGSRHSLAKIHYDLGRRYSDSSYLHALKTVSEKQALSLYSEVLLKLETHYVTAPNWAALVDRGAQSLQIAVYEKGFREKNLAGKSNAQLDAYVGQLRRLIDSRPARTRQQAVDTVTEAARFSQLQVGLSSTAVSLEFACAAIGALDSYSAYLTSDQLTDVYSQIEGNFVGLGIELKSATGALQIVKVITGSPAERSGIHAGDKITEVDGQATAELSTDQAADLLQGPEGSMVNLILVNTKNVPRRMSVRREHVEVPSVDEVHIENVEQGIGYLKLTCFQKTTTRDLDAALWKLHREGMKSLIMDLRGNPGGLLTSSVEVADKFVEQGVIVSTRGRSPLEDYNYTAHKAGTWRIPLVVLIDGESASASEIFAGAIHDHRRGKIIGQRSYGKGSVQGIFPLTVAGAGVRLTTAKFYSPSGQPIAHVGVQPDIVVQTTAKLTGENASGNETKVDPELNAALQELGAGPLSAKR